MWYIHLSNKKKGKKKKVSNSIAGYRKLWKEELIKVANFLIVLFYKIDTIIPIFSNYHPNQSVAVKRQDTLPAKILQQLTEDFIF